MSVCRAGSIALIVDQRSVHGDSDSTVPGSLQ